MDSYTVPDIEASRPQIVDMNASNKRQALAAINKRKSLAAKMAHHHSTAPETAVPPNVDRLRAQCAALPAHYGRFPADAEDGAERERTRGNAPPEFAVPFWQSRRDELHLLATWLADQGTDPTSADVSAWLRLSLPDWLSAKAQTFPDKLVVFTGEGAFPVFPGDRITKAAHPDYDHVCAIERTSGLDFDPRTGEPVESVPS